MAVLAVPLALLSACGSAAPAKVAAAAGPVQVSVSACGQGWTATRAGAQKIELKNTDSRAGEVQLISAKTGALFAAIEPFGPGTTRELDISLAAGDYQLRCLMEDEAAITGAAFSLTGKGVGDSRGVVPQTEADLISPTKKYESYVKGRLPALARETERLSADIARGELGNARKDWLVAHLAYERLGAAYDAFGDLDGAINGLPNGLPRGVHDASWSGFHRIEYGLWHGASATTLNAPAGQLEQDIVALRKQFRTVQIDPLTVTIRAHEITENALQFALTGQDDFGSHTGLATVRANLDGTTEVLSLLAPQLRTAGIDRTPITQGVRRAEDLLDAQHHNGVWVSETALPRTAREDIDAAISELTELLAPVAAALEPRRIS
ncbi:MAG: Periplasmic lipoprotein involved in iron transport-like protein [Marmoricola sp.]|nr:Periplasmic lipoprotein involved in iron transport-like protein [Marmoricola sp.]